MVDPFHGNRAKKQEAAQAAFAKAMNITKQRPMDLGQVYNPNYQWDTKKTFLHPVHKYSMNEWEYNVYIQEEKDKETEREESERERERERVERTETATASSASSTGGVRENQQYTLALKTAFELGMNAGLMQRAPPPPCSACERRKERNRIAAQTSRVEKRKLELSLTQTRRIIRSTSGPPPPAPTFPSNTSTSTATTKVDYDDEEEDEEDEEQKIEPPPF